MSKPLMESIGGLGYCGITLVGGRDAQVVLCASSSNRPALIISVEDESGNVASLRVTLRDAKRISRQLKRLIKWRKGWEQ